MKVLVFANDLAWNELIACSNDIEWLRAETVDAFTNRNDIDAYFYLSGDTNAIDHSSFKKPLFINSVSVTLKKIPATGNVYRINGWNGFLKRNSWEVAGNINTECNAILNSMNKKIIPVPDEPGLIAARIIAMIINEAYFAKAENVSTGKEIDIAMKLGTNYPHGPFEWAQTIGITNVYSLLKTLSETDIRYKPSTLLEQEATKR